MTESLRASVLTPPVCAIGDYMSHNNDICCRDGNIEEGIDSTRKRD